MYLLSYFLTLGGATLPRLPRGRRVLHAGGLQVVDGHLTGLQRRAADGEVLLHDEPFRAGRETGLDNLRNVLAAVADGTADDIPSSSAR